jgi:CspA family cold shock protein
MRRDYPPSAFAGVVTADHFRLDMRLECFGRDLIRRLKMANGVIKWYNQTKGYGFIQPADGGKDVFVHASAVERSDLERLVEGQTIAYEVERDRRTGKDSAVNLRSA